MAHCIILSLCMRLVQWPGDPMFLIKVGQEWKGKDEKEERNKGNNHLA